MIFCIEAAVLCVLFFLFVTRSLVKNPLAWISDYPPAVIARAKTLGLVPESRKITIASLLLPKLFRCLFAACFFALLTVFVNGAETFTESFLLSYGLWLVLAWFDAFVIDCLFFTHCPAVRIPGTEDMEEAYHDCLFHIRMSGIGTLLGLPVCLLAGGLSCLLRML